ncbi:MAG: pitrilysin family protein [Vicinamibacterales bacterium]|nr:pitrilysin family protein [Vicinamibacterales bacterium]
MTGRWAAGAAVILVLGCVTASAQQPLDWPRESPPPPLPARQVTFPPYELRTLPNGLQVVVVMHHEQPAVNLRLMIGAGAASDPVGKKGVAALAGQLLDQGTANRSATDVAEAIDYLGGVLSVGAGTDLSFANVLVMRDSFDFAVDLLAEITRTPSFEQAEIDRQRQQVLSGIQVSMDDPAYLAGVVFARLVYGDHPYGMPHNGTPQTVLSISRDDLRAFHQTHYAPNNALLAIVGDVDAEEAFASVERVFGDWERRPLPPTPSTQPPAPARRIVVVDKPGSVQTAIRVGHVALPRASPDHLAFDVALKILGGEGGNRLGSVLRTERSLTYAASADVASRRFGGDFMAKTDTRSDATAEVLRLIVEEVARLKRERVGRRELENAQAYLSGSFPLTIETPNAIAAQVLESLLYGLDLGDLPKYPERINAVTVDEIQRVSREYLQPQQLSVVLVGEAATFLDDLAGVGFDDVEVLLVSELDRFLGQGTAQATLESPLLAP